jgi:hypothetical protein
MSGSSTIKQWNPGANNQATDEEYLVDTLRTGGAPIGALFPSKTGNKLFYQLSTMAAALAQALADKGYDVSDEDFTALTAVMANIRTRDIGVRDSFRGLVAGNNATHPTYQVDLTCDEAILQDADGNCVRISGVSVTYDITTDLDGGSETNSVWYHMWLFGKADGSYTHKLSLDPAAPTAPAGYTYKAYAGAVYNNSSGNLMWFKQIDKRVGCVFQAPLVAGTATDWTSVSLASIIPPTAKMLYGTGEQYYVDQTLISSIQGNFTNHVILQAAILTPGADTMVIVPFTLPVLVPQTIYYKNRSASGSTYIYVNGWEY